MLQLGGSGEATKYYDSGNVVHVCFDHNVNN